MAGLSSRFFEKGYTIPKYMLDLNGVSIFEWSLSSFKNFYDSDFFIFIILDHYDTRKFIEEKIKKTGIINFEIVTLNEKTKGQADTVYQGIKNINIDQEIYIFNIDSKLNRFEKINTESIDGYLEVFQGEGEHWSFIVPGKECKVLKTTEKNRVSNLCSNGLYYFKSSNLFKKIIEEEIINFDENEIYIAPIYNKYISLGMNIIFKEVSINDTSFCGTPQEYLDTKNSMKGAEK